MWDLNNYIKTWLRSHRCASNTQIRKKVYCGTGRSSV